jgi:hypothetical protein
LFFTAFFTDLVTTLEILLMGLAATSKKKVLFYLVLLASSLYCMCVPVYASIAAATPAKYSFMLATPRRFR